LSIGELEKQIEFLGNAASRCELYAAQAPEGSLDQRDNNRRAVAYRLEQEAILRESTVLREAVDEVCGRWVSNVVKTPRWLENATYLVAAFALGIVIAYIMFCYAKGR